MSVTISDEILHASRMTEAEFKLEIAILLFQQSKLSLGHASRLAGINKPQFQNLLTERQIPLYFYDVEDYEQDLKTLQTLGDL